MTKNEDRKTKNGPGEQASIRDFMDLQAWKLARELRMRVYEISKKFPPEERHVLTSQIRRAAVSVTANLAEGYGRYSYQENSQFCRQSRASAYELRDHLTTALDQEYVSKEIWLETESLARRVIQVVFARLRD